MIKSAIKSFFIIEKMKKIPEVPSSVVFNAKPKMPSSESIAFILGQGLLAKKNPFLERND